MTDISVSKSQECVGGVGLNKNLMLWLAEAYTNKSNNTVPVPWLLLAMFLWALRVSVLVLCLFYCKSSKEEGGAHLWLVLLLPLCQWKRDTSWLEWVGTPVWNEVQDLFSPLCWNKQTGFTGCRSHSLPFGKGYADSKTAVKENRMNCDQKAIFWIKKRLWYS